MLFLDEIHRMSRPAEEMLYLAMEDFRVDVIVGKGPGATAIPLELPPFTVVGATTRAGLLPAPLRDRFGFTGHLDFYVDRRARHVILRRSCPAARASRPTRPASPRSRAAPAARPRIANRLLRRVRDWAQVHGEGLVDLDAARAALALFDVDERGPRPARPGRARGAVPPVRRGTGRPDDAGGRRGGGGRHRRDGRRAVPGARGLHGAHAAGPGRRAAGLGAPRPGAATAAEPRRGRLAGGSGLRTAPAARRAGPLRRLTPAYRFNRA